MIKSTWIHDFVGSTAVHMVGGVCAMIGASILGYNITFAAHGVFILWFCRFVFSRESTVGMNSDALMETAGRVFFNANLSAAIACVTILAVTWIRYKKPDVSMTYNAALAGLVGITVGYDAVSPLGAAIIGFICGVVIVFAVEFIATKIKFVAMVQSNLLLPKVIVKQNEKLKK